MNESSGREIMRSLIQFKKLKVHNQCEYGLHPSEIHTLFLLTSMLKENPDGVFTTDLSKKLNVSTPTITQKITSMEQKGFVERVHSKKDRRKVRILISDNAKELVKSMKDDFLKKCIGLSEILGDSDSEKLSELLDKTYTYFTTLGEQENL